MFTLEYRQKYSSHGLIDDFVLYGVQEDYINFAKAVEQALASPHTASTITTLAHIYIEITLDDTHDELFTSLQNKDNEYYSRQDWLERNILRVRGCHHVLACLQDFLLDVADRGVGYSYISEYSSSYTYSLLSPEWRLHVQNN